MRQGFQRPFGLQSHHNSRRGVQAAHMIRQLILNGLLKKDVRSNYQGNPTPETPVPHFMHWEFFIFMAPKV